LLSTLASRERSHVKRDDSHRPRRANCEQCARFGLQQAQSHMTNQQGISRIQSCAESSTGWSQVPEPKSHARRRIRKRIIRARKPNCEGEVREASEILIRSQDADERSYPRDCENCLMQPTLWIAPNKSDYTEVPAIYKGMAQNVGSSLQSGPMQGRCEEARKRGSAARIIKVVA